VEHIGQKIIIDYSIRPSLVKMELAEHPSHTTALEIDLSGAQEVSVLLPGEDEISGHEMFWRLKRTGKSVLDVRILEELLMHKELIPESWKNIKPCYFWGTIFRDGANNLCVAYLHWDGRDWQWGIDWLSFYFEGGDIFCLKA
jgi:hypothetical protein